MPRPCKLTFDQNFDLESGVQVTCDVGYLGANFSLPRSLCSRLRADVRDRRQTDVRRTSSLNAPYPRGGSIIILTAKEQLSWWFTFLIISSAVLSHVNGTFVASSSGNRCSLEFFLH